MPTFDVFRVVSVIVLCAWELTTAVAGDHVLSRNTL